MYRPIPRPWAHFFLHSPLPGGGRRSMMAAPPHFSCSRAVRVRFVLRQESSAGETPGHSHRISLTVLTWEQSRTCFKLHMFRFRLCFREWTSSFACSFFFYLLYTTHFLAFQHGTAVLYQVNSSSNRCTLRTRNKSQVYLSISTNSILNSKQPA